MIITIEGKCSDMFTATDGEREYSGYVPKAFCGNEGEDYIHLKIDSATGRILNWNEKKALKMFSPNYDQNNP